MKTKWVLFTAAVVVLFGAVPVRAQIIESNRPTAASTSRVTPGLSPAQPATSQPGPKAGKATASGVNLPSHPALSSAPLPGRGVPFPADTNGADPALDWRHPDGSATASSSPGLATVTQREDAVVEHAAPPLHW